MRTATTLALIFLLLSGSPGRCQTSTDKIKKSTPSSAHNLIAVKVTGTNRYTEREILPASGLHLGQNVGEGNFKDAVQRLGDTGLFTDVAYSYSYSSAGTKLEFQLTDVPQKNLVPAHFENFVWFTDAELLAELQRRIPLFKQLVPVAGTFPDRVEAALQAILEEKHLPGHVDYLRQGKDGGDLTGFAYRVTDVDIRIRDVECPGAAPEHVPLLKAAARRLIGADYDRDSLAAVARLDLLPVYLQRGYLKAEFSQSDARVVESSPSDSEIQVDAILPVTAGKVYSISDVAWKGNAAIASNQLQSLVHLQPGHPADAVRLASDLEEISKLYRNQGYMIAHVASVPTFDEEKVTVHYDLNVVEGDQFKMGELELVGLDSQSKARMQEAWNLAEGQPYNAAYLKKFLEINFGALPGGSHWGATVNETLNEKEKTVDVTIRFSPR